MIDAREVAERLVYVFCNEESKEKTGKDIATLVGAADFLDKAPIDLAYPAMYPKELLNMHSETLRMVATGRNVSADRVDMCYKFLNDMAEKNYS